MFYELAALSVHNPLRARARLMMTSSGVMIGTTAVILLIVLTIGLQNAAESSIGNDATLTQITVRSGFRRDSSGPALNMDTVTDIAALKNVSGVIPVLSPSSQVELHVGNLRGFTHVYGIYPASLPYLGVKAQQDYGAIGVRAVAGDSHRHRWHRCRILPGAAGGPHDYRHRTTHRMRT